MKIKIPTTILLFFLSTISPPPTTAGHPSPPPSTNSDDFIRTSCKTTLYPQLCFTSLSGYSSAVQQDSGRLALVAIGVTLSKATNISKYISTISTSISQNSTNNPRVSAAVHDCKTVVGDAVGDIRESLRQMRQLSGSGEALRFEVSNVQTWMSAALTNEETCSDGFEDFPVDGGVKAEVCDRVEEVKKVTSNALALVNSFANTIQTP